MESFQLVFYCLFSSIIFAEGNLRIVGGQKVPLEFGLFHASLQNLTGHHVCGGVVISHRHLITAAHCIYGAETEFIKVVVGTVNLNKGGLTYDVEAIYIHDDYNHPLKLNDIAVLKIRGLFDLQYVKIIRLDEIGITHGDKVLLLGFGARQPHGESADHMLYLNQTVFNQETCRYANRYIREVHDSNFCTFTKKGQGTCHGDSGSPVVKDDKLAGIVSWGIPCAVGYPDIHTRISPYVKWIRSVMDKSLSKYCN